MLLLLVLLVVEVRVVIVVVVVLILIVILSNIIVSFSTIFNIMLVHILIAVKAATTA